MIRPTSQITNQTTSQRISKNTSGKTMIVSTQSTSQTTKAPPWITSAEAALYLTSGSSLPTKRKMRLPIGGSKAQARIVYRFLLLPVAPAPPIGVGWPGGGGGICDMGALLEKLICARRLWVGGPQNAIVSNDRPQRGLPR